MRAVAADPAAEQGRIDFGVPLMPVEYAELLRRNANMQEFAGLVRSYGEANPESWAGMFIDQRAGGTIVAQFSRDADLHRERLLKLLPLHAKVDVRAVAWSLRELADFAQQVEADPWFDAIGAEVSVVSPNEAENAIEIWFTSRDPTDAARVAEHYGNPGWLTGAVWMAPEWTGPRGDLIIIAVDAHDRPVPRLQCRYRAEDRLAQSDPGTSWGTGDDGRCRIQRLPAVWYEVTLWAPDATGNGYTLVGSARARVTSGGTARVRIVVDSP